MKKLRSKLRHASAADAAAIIELIRELARYERLEHEMISTPSKLRKALTGPRPSAFALVMEADKKIVGFALYFFNFSTFLARRGLYLEDLYVQPQYRGKGFGLRLFQKLAQIAVAKKCGRMEWAVLDWNQPAIEFYKNFGARPLQDWTLFRLEHHPLARLAKGSKVPKVKRSDSDSPALTPKRRFGKN
jgi:GNAT superfamily N-acetyltransferase